MPRRLSIIILATALLQFGWPAAAQTDASPQGSYRPGLGDMMTMTVQPRHIKLAEAARERNWTYAAYELHELQEAFDRIAAVWPEWQHYPIAAMIKFNLADPFAALETAIKASDSAKFDSAYKLLTESCDSCHQAAGREMVVIKVPGEATFPDQDFAPHP
ncbi:MAG TPA: hypothetical protein VHX19_15875 [Stellaceae bacterium]|jgi:cytochrome c556|nr:hypothetical protein [Stellaceae bacterium]